MKMEMERVYIITEVSIHAIMPIHNRTNLMLLGVC